MSALDSLNALVKVPGALKIITDEIRPELRKDADKARSELDFGKVQDSVDDDSPLKTDPSLALKKHSTFVLQDVTRIEETVKGRVRAYSDDGSYTEGYPEDVLNRLMEHSR